MSTIFLLYINNDHHALVVLVSYDVRQRSPRVSSPGPYGQQGHCLEGRKTGLHCSQQEIPVREEKSTCGRVTGETGGKSGENLGDGKLTQSPSGSKLSSM